MKIICKVSSAILTMICLCCFCLVYYYGNAGFHGYIILFGILKLWCYDKILMSEILSNRTVNKCVHSCMFNLQSLTGLAPVWHLDQVA